MAFAENGASSRNLVQKKLESPRFQVALAVRQHHPHVPGGVPSESP